MPQIRALFCALLVIDVYRAEGNPCDAANHIKFPEIGSRNTKCTNRTEVCDHYLQENWYVAPKSLLVNSCPAAGSCGVDYPTWLNGTLPDLVDGVVNRTGCTVRNGNCCEDTIRIKVKNCTGYYVYHLKPLKQCSSAYCFESTLPCDSKPLHPTTTQPPVTNTEESKEGIDNGLLIGILCGVAVLVVMTGTILLVFAKTNICHKTANTVNDIEIPSSIPEKSMPPAYEEIPKHAETGYIHAVY